MEHSYSEEYAAYQRLNTYRDTAAHDRLVAQLRRHQHSPVARMLAWLGSLLEQCGAALRRRYAAPLPSDNGYMRMS